MCFNKYFDILFSMNEQNRTTKPLSVNWHFWPWCNMKCKFCFATFNDVKTVLPKETALLVLKMLRGAGTEKITFVGGEPMLCPYIGDLLKRSKEVGLVTKIVSNGTNITQKFLTNYGQYIDYITLSLDSSSNKVAKDLGRGGGNYVDEIKRIALLIKAHSIPLQINSTITKLNWQEDMNKIISELDPIRWKVFQVLKIEGQNSNLVDDLLISYDEFNYFKQKHQKNSRVIFEDNDLMTGSYIMLDPIGRFFDNITGKHNYSESIFSIGVLEAFYQTIWRKEKFIKRNGLYYQLPQKKSLLKKLNLKLKLAEGS